MTKASGSRKVSCETQFDGAVTPVASEPREHTSGYSHGGPRGPSSARMTYTHTGRARDSFMSTVEPEQRRGWIQEVLERGLKSRVFDVTLSCCLIIALFGQSVWIIFDIPDDPGNAVLDAIMCVIMFLFIIEVMLNCVVHRREYVGSFFFFADIVGSFSMVFEISFMFGRAGTMATMDSSFDTMLLRTARAAKMGARAGRLSKLVKCMPLLFGGKNVKVSTKESNGIEARVLSQKLTQKLSTKVSVLTIVLVVVVPLFSLGQYPEEDLSMRAWSARLEEDYSRAYELVMASKEKNATTDIFLRSINLMNTFYQQTQYYPFAADGYSTQVGDARTIPGEHMLAHDAPRRKQNIVRQMVPTCMVARPDCQGSLRAAVYFNFVGPNKLQAGQDIFVICFIVFVMGLSSFDLSKTINRLMMVPLEKMLHSVCMTASQILVQVSNMSGGGDSAHFLDDHGEEGVTEMELLDRVLKKLVTITNMDMQQNVIAQEELEDMGEEGRGVVMEMMQMGANTGQPSPSEDERRRFTDSSRRLSGSYVVTDLSIDRAAIESWELDLLALPLDEPAKVSMFIFFDSRTGKNVTRHFVEVDTFRRFQEGVTAGYKENAYHNWVHATDICYTVFRLLESTQSHFWLSDIEQYALLVASLCHDLGHFGLTNPFLTETKHELALLYNDKSPLENLHCSSLFEICMSEGKNIFEFCSNGDYKRARKVCIECILHTDNANHFQMVKDISKIYELNSALCDAQAIDPFNVLPEYESDILRKDSLLWLELFLHLADVSNPLKPFSICEAWAVRVLDEFFLQGDEEKRLGVPVGILNDRDKVNLPGSQHGFINFLVAPLVFSVIGIFPVLHCLGREMSLNLETWRNVWVEEVRPGAEDQQKRDFDVEKVSMHIQLLDRQNPLAQQEGKRSVRKSDTEAAG